jgi:hypothetical protein
MIGQSNSFTMRRDGSAFAGICAADSVRGLASTSPSKVPTVIFYTMGRQLMAGLIEGATEE